jgi:hypothetical protein
MVNLLNEFAKDHIEMDDFCKKLAKKILMKGIDIDILS